MLTIEGVSRTGRKEGGLSGLRLQLACDGLPPSTKAVMDEQPSPPNTQLINDTQRLGRNPSGLNDKDLSDVIAILHPYTNVAIKAVAEVARISPQHILQNELLPDGDLDQHDDEEVLDIALRLSSKLKDPCAGFRFGRNTSSCDVVLGQSGPMPMVSNVHFRIYLTPDEVLMLQDTSTNGTVVDGVILGRLWVNQAAKAAHVARAGNEKPKETRVDPNTARRRDGRDVTSRMLTQGSIINLISSCDRSHEEIKFIVRIPSRHGHEDAYERRLGQFLELVERETQERALVAPRLHINGNAADLVRMVSSLCASVLTTSDAVLPILPPGGPTRPLTLFHDRLPVIVTILGRPSFDGAARSSSLAALDPRLEVGLRRPGPAGPSTMSSAPSARVPSRPCTRSPPRMTARSSRPRSSASASSARTTRTIESSTRRWTS